MVAELTNVSLMHLGDFWDKSSHWISDGKRWENNRKCSTGSDLQAIDRSRKRRSHLHHGAIRDISLPTWCPTVKSVMSSSVFLRRQWRCR